MDAEIWEWVSSSIWKSLFVLKFVIKFMFDTTYLLVKSVNLPNLWWNLLAMCKMSKRNRNSLVLMEHYSSLYDWLNLTHNKKEWKMSNVLGALKNISRNNGVGVNNNIFIYLCFRCWLSCFPSDFERYLIFYKLFYFKIFEKFCQLNVL